MCISSNVVRDVSHFMEIFSWREKKNDKKVFFLFWGRKLFVPFSYLINRVQFYLRAVSMEVRSELEVLDFFPPTEYSFMLEIERIPSVPLRDSPNGSVLYLDNTVCIFLADDRLNAASLR